MVCLTLALIGCNGTSSTVPIEEDPDSLSLVMVNVDDRKQIIRNFGASDAWVCQYVGIWPDEKRKQVAQWLFSKEVDSNSKPLGIGLSLWRFNIGAGSAGQTDIDDPWRRTEGFLNADGTYNWTKQQGQQWFLKAAKDHGVEKLLAFTNSPPVSLTQNGKAYASAGTQANISPENYIQFSRFLVNVMEHFKEQGLSIDYLSPFNEPQWDWTGSGQEGSPYTNLEMFKITKILDSLLSHSSVETKIQIAEAGKLNYLYEEADKKTRANQIFEFFNSGSPTYVGNLSGVDKVISGHSYFTSNPVETLQQVRSQLYNTMMSSGTEAEFWQSEYCILGDQEEINANGKDMGIDPALYVAKIIHHDLTVANAAAWHWWLAVSVYDYKDGLIYADKNTSNGNVADSKTLWALGNFSRFIRPGAHRIGVTSDGININNPRGLMISSYVNSNNELVTVAINYSNSGSHIRLDIKNGDVTNPLAYRTSAADDENLKPIVIDDLARVPLPKRSITTLVMSLK